MLNVEISYYCNECIRVLSLYSRYNIVNDATFQCNHCSQENVINNSNHAKELSLYLIGSKTYRQKFNILAADLLLECNMTGVTPSIVNEQNKSLPLFFLLPLTYLFYCTTEKPSRSM